MKKIIRTRYAPSPTGLFHIGGARTALFNFLFAKKNNGDFIVRIEDTDVERNVVNGIESQLDNLRWLKIFFDESILNPGNYGPYIQSEKLDRYKELAYKLLSDKKAYRCFCSPEKLASDREKALKNGQTPKYHKTCLLLSEKEIENKLNKSTPFSIRLNIEKDIVISWNDLIRGEISFPSSALTDPVILKSNNYPTYNFAVVVDDYDMNITHVIRGEEHISNTPYQIAIKNALKFRNTIKFAHLSVIVDESGKKLSKRNLELKQFIEDYKNMGFTPEAVTNFLYLLGLPAENNQEIFTINEAINNFDLSKISKSPSTFDFKKMEWISSEYFKKMSNSLYLFFVDNFIQIDLDMYKEKRNDILLLFKNQISYAKQLNDLIANLFFSKPDLKVICEELNTFEAIDLKHFINTLNNYFTSLENWSEEEISKTINQFKSSTGYSGKNLFMPIRLLCTHFSHGPELAKILYLFGKEKVLNNISMIESKIKKKEK